MRFTHATIRLSKKEVIDLVLANAEAKGYEPLSAELVLDPSDDGAIVRVYTKKRPACESSSVAPPRP